jgi:hypothetical protein
VPPVERNSRIARRVRQTRNATYEKSHFAKIFFHAFFPGNSFDFEKFRAQRCVKRARAPLRCGDGSLASE